MGATDSPDFNPVSDYSDRTANRPASFSYRLKFWARR